LLRTLRTKVWPRIPTLRIPSTNRITLDRELRRHFCRMEPGRVLDVGSKGAPYRESIPHTDYLRLDIVRDTSPEICCDVHDFVWDGEPFDSIVALEVLEHLYAPELAIERLGDALRPGGVCILSTRFLYRYHPDPEDHYRFTPDSLRYLFRRFSLVEIHPHGNRLQTIWEMMNAGGRSRVFLNLLNHAAARLPGRDQRFPLGFVVYAVR
jgi:SAM-dependent methyltransferase